MAWFGCIYPLQIVPDFSSELLKTERPTKELRMIYSIFIIISTYYIAYYQYIMYNWKELKMSASESNHHEWDFASNP